MNEYCNLSCLLLLMLMSDFQPDLEMRQHIGTSYIASICVYGVIHILAMLVGTSCKICRRYKRWNYKRQQKNRQQRQRERQIEQSPAAPIQALPPLSAIREVSEEESKHEDSGRMVLEDIDHEHA